jgi:hypothetical protein
MASLRRAIFFDRARHETGVKKTRRRKRSCAMVRRILSVLLL